MKTPTFKVAFIDDEEQILKALRRSMRKQPIECQYFRNAKALLAELSNSEFDVIVSDMRMPDMDGAKLFEELENRGDPAIRVLLTGHSDQADTVKAINDGQIFKYLNKPWSDEVLFETIKDAIRMRFSQKEQERLQEVTKEQNVLLKDSYHFMEKKVDTANAELDQTMDMLEVAYKETKVAIDQCVRLLADSLSKRVSPFPGYNSEVAQFSVILAKQLELSEPSIKSLEYAALVNDIGKVEFPDHLLSPDAEMTRLQLKEFKKHPILADHMLLSVDYLHDAGRIVRQHRERWDGRGYPDGLQADEIDIEAQLLSLAVDFIVMVREYERKGEEGLDQAKIDIAKRFGQHYLPSLARPFEISCEIYKDSRHSPYEEIVKLVDCTEGKTLTRDLQSKGGVLLVTKGTELTEKLLDRLKKVQAFEDTEYLLHIFVSSLEHEEIDPDDD